ncbi:hypothetical protein O3P69_011469 [Scylla paramamosain]|uniref:Uncharacterized protein n=1 Tax=Scylla paramamosain TaxID=85552 RepID=A0AAW0T6P8_SCYPA
MKERLPPARSRPLYFIHAKHRRASPPFTFRHHLVTPSPLSRLTRSAVTDLHDYLLPVLPFSRHIHPTTSKRCTKIHINYLPAWRPELDVVSVVTPETECKRSHFTAVEMGVSEASIQTKQHLSPVQSTN